MLVFWGVHHLGDGFKYLLISSLFGEDSHFDEHILQDGLKPPTSHEYTSYISKRTPNIPLEHTPKPPKGKNSET